jgi:hypothetical protein
MGKIIYKYSKIKKLNIFFNQICYQVRLRLSLRLRLRLRLRFRLRMILILILIFNVFSLGGS